MKTFINDLLAGLSVSFVALSLGAAFGVLSEVGAYSGMIAAAIYPLVTSFLGGSRIQCAGPTGPMTTVFIVLFAGTVDAVTQIFPEISPLHIFSSLLGLTGLFLILFGLFRLGKLVEYVPRLVLSGFMNGVACLIWLSQLKRLFGWGGSTAFEGGFYQNVLLAFFTMLFALVLGTFIKKSQKWYVELIPVVLISLVLFSAIAGWYQLDVQLVDLGFNHFNVDRFLDIASSHVPSFVNFQYWWVIAPFALNLAVVAALDTLLTSLIIDRMIAKKSQRNRELVAQGVATITSGLVGGLPGAQATERSVLMVHEGAQTRLANFLVGVFVISFLALFIDYVELIPMAVFAGILMKVGYDVFDWTSLVVLFKKVWNTTSLQVFIQLLLVLGTMLMTVFVDLAMAVFVFTLLFWILQKYFPVADLVMETESEGMSDEP